MSEASVESGSLPLDSEAPALAAVTIRPFPLDRRQRSAFRRSAGSRGCRCSSPRLRAPPQLRV